MAHEAKKDVTYISVSYIFFMDLALADERRGTVKIKHPEWLQVKLNNANLFGYDQDWYATSFQRTRGCGPTAAAMLLSYLNRREAGPLPYDGNSIPAITNVLEDVWQYVTPNWLLGLNSTEKFCKGVAALLGYYGLNWQCRRLSVAAFAPRRISLAQAVSFLEAGLAADCPIAFLNLQKGRATALESWHWIVIISLDYDALANRYTVECYDGGRAITFDLGLWLKSTRFGGGFVYLTKP